jgi:hypothetical protein
MTDLEPAVRASRLRMLVALEIVRIVHDFRARQDLLVGHWSRFRNRDVLLDLVFSRWRGLGFTDLATFADDAILLLEAFYREIDGVRLYLTVTEDMPTTLADTLAWHADRMERAARAAFVALDVAIPFEAGTDPMRLVADHLSSLPADDHEE